MTAATTEPPDEVLEIIRFAALSEGPRLLILGAVHGNESCGPEGIGRAVAAIREGRLVLRRGLVTFLPVANPKARRLNAREGDRNLNRDLRERTLPDNFEDRVGNRLCAMLREHDVLLDIHSFTAAGTPFVFAGLGDGEGLGEPSPLAVAERNFAMRLGPDLVIDGWMAGYGRYLSERARLGHPPLLASEPIGTTEYMRFLGRYGATIECGRHDDPEAANVAYGAIVRALAVVGLIDGEPPPVTAKRSIRIVDSLVCGRDGDRMEGTWNTGDPISAGAVIARRVDGEVLVAPRDGYLIFPNANAKPGQQLCYFGVGRSPGLD